MRNAAEQTARFSLIAAALLLLSACGWHTVYGAHNSDDNSVVATQLNQISIENIPDRKGQILRNDLIDLMYGKGRPSQPLYTLSTKIRSTEEDVGQLQDATSTLTLMNMYADYDLKLPNGTVVLHGTAHSVTSFGKLNDEYGTLAAREDAISRTLNEVSEQMLTRISMYFSDQGQKK